MLKVDIGDRCTHCGGDTAFGSGRFVNRIPSGATGKIVLPKGQEYLEEAFDIDGTMFLEVLLDIEVSGYMCPDCQEGEDE